jgi:hypothetical protein
MVCNIVLSAKVLCFSAEIFAELFLRKWRCGELAINELYETTGWSTAALLY